MNPQETHSKVYRRKDTLEFSKADFGHFANSIHRRTVMTLAVFLCSQFISELIFESILPSPQIRICLSTPPRRRSSLFFNQPMEDHTRTSTLLFFCPWSKWVHLYYIISCYSFCPQSRCVHSRHICKNSKTYRLQVWLSKSTSFRFHDAVTYFRSASCRADFDCIGWRRPIGCLTLQVSFRKRPTNYRDLLRKETYKDKASYASSPPCTTVSLSGWNVC